MIAESLKFITSLKEDAMEPHVTCIDGKVYCDKKLTRYDEEPLANEIRAATLTAMVDYIKNCGEEMQGNMIVHVISPCEVALYSGLTDERKREYLFRSRAIVPDVRLEQWQNQEMFLINMQANFEMTEDLAAILKVAGNVEAKTTQSYGDDGVTQKATIKQGIASKADVLVPNPVTLVPYRTFLEVKQPESQFVFRMKDVNGEPAFKLIEAEGGLWKLKAMECIKCWLEQELFSDSDDRNGITIIA